MSMNQHTQQECAVEIAVAIVSHLSSLRELSRARMISRTFRDGVSLDLGSRIRSIVTGHYVSSEHYDDFRALLSRTDSLLMGKWAELLAGPSNSWSAIRTQQRLSPSWVLLVACPRDSADEWREYLVNHQLLDCGFAEMYVGPAVRTATCFTHQHMGGAVVVVESETRSSMSIVLAQRGSCNRRGINKSYVFDLHPAVSAAGENVETGRDSVSAMSTCAVELRRPKGGALYVQYAPDCGNRYGHANRSLRHVWTLKGWCLNKNCVWFSRRIQPMQSSFAPETIIDVTQTKRKYEGMGFPVGLFYGTQVGKVECVPVPPIVPCKDQYSEWDLRYDVWMRCPLVAQHVLYWGDLSFQRICSSDSRGDTRYLLCTDDPTNENLNENLTVYSVLKGFGASRSPVWRGNLLVLSISRRGRVQSLCNSDLHAVNDAVCAHNVCCELLGVFPADLARFGDLAEDHLCRLRLKGTPNDESRYMEMLGRLLTPVSKTFHVNGTGVKRFQVAVNNHLVMPSGLYLEHQFITIEVTVPKNVQFLNRGNIKEMLTVIDLCDPNGRPRMAAETAALYQHENLIAKTIGVASREAEEPRSKTSQTKVIIAESIETLIVGNKWYDTPPCDGPVGLPLFRLVDNVEADETDDEDGPPPSESQNDSEESVCRSVTDSARSDVQNSPTSVSFSSVSSATPDPNRLVPSKLFREGSPASSRIDDIEGNVENATTTISPYRSAPTGQPCPKNFVGDLSNFVQSLLGAGYSGSPAFGRCGQEGPASWNWNVSGTTRPWELDVTDPVVLEALSCGAGSRSLGAGSQGSAMGSTSETTSSGYSNVTVSDPYLSDVATTSLAQVQWREGLGENVTNRTTQQSCSVTPASFSSDRTPREGGKNRTASHSTASSSRVSKPGKVVNKTQPKKRKKRQPFDGEHQFELKTFEYRFMPVNLQGQPKSAGQDLNILSFQCHCHPNGSILNRILFRPSVVESGVTGSHQLTIALRKSTLLLTLRTLNNEVDRSDGESTQSMAEKNGCTEYDEPRMTPVVSRGAGIGCRGMAPSVERGRCQGTGVKCEDSGNTQFTGSLKYSSGRITTWVDSVDGTDTVEQHSPKQYEDAAIQTGLSNETSGPKDVTQTAPQKSYRDLEDGMALAQQVASVAWDKYWNAEKERSELEETAQAYKKQRHQAEKERLDSEQIAEKYKRQRDNAVNRLRETIRDKKKAEVESRFWRQRIREIGGKMMELSDKTLKFGYE
ncbi:hypothetical protein K435DRAFT_809630 [Dendrothele bispora CBS 962.96]|uniref:Uncharacterized protein n=1 Tax=Dendrothele bispora (strain CBS 962.96) TaxID=1314807 RepID=A0A4S8KXM1_DENBC|nr:hypothetical protein K435DRAFT_809630 [Dendrothele bispora CBS 962.96]